MKAFLRMQIIWSTALMKSPANNSEKKKKKKRKEKKNLNKVLEQNVANA